MAFTCVIILTEDFTVIFDMNKDLSKRLNRSDSPITIID